MEININLLLHSTFFRARLLLMAPKKKIVTATIPLTPDDVKMIERLKVRLRIFKTTALIRHSLRELGRNGKAR